MRCAIVLLLVASAASGGETADQVAALLKKGDAHLEKCRNKQARASYEQALSLAQGAALGPLEGRARTGLGTLCNTRGDYPGAAAQLKRAIELLDSAEEDVRAARARVELGDTYIHTNRVTEALAIRTEALIAYQRAQHVEGATIALVRVGTAHLELGNLVQCIRSYEEALALSRQVKFQRGEAAALGALGAFYLIAGDLDRAERLAHEAIALHDAPGSRTESAVNARNLGWIQMGLKRFDAAEETLLRAHEALRHSGDDIQVAATALALGTLYVNLGRYDESLKRYEEARQLYEHNGASHRVLRAEAAKASVLARQNKCREALPIYQRVAIDAEAAGTRLILADTWFNIAACQMSLGQFSDSLQAAYKSVAVSSGMLGRLSDDLGSTARSSLADVAGVGFYSAMKLRDARGAFFFVEAGRAGALLESLNCREAIYATKLPPELKRADLGARAHEAVMLSEFRATAEKGDSAETKRATERLSAARRARTEVVQRIQREAKRAASVLYPKPADVEDIAKLLGPTDAIVLFQNVGREKEILWAYVLTAGNVDLNDLSLTREIRAACRALRADNVNIDAGAAIARLKKLLVDYLFIKPHIKRIFVSPVDELSHIPFALLYPDREIVYIPSATAWALVQSEQGKRGKGVLALGGPEYGTMKSAPVVSVQRGDWLKNLPASRAEAKAVGTENDVLLGRRASEAALRKLVMRQRWRAVHVACHALIDSERPAFSTLALSAGDGHDGFLSVLDILCMEVPADLVVLSACRTGRGKVVKGEGIMGFTRAFMVAGAPRVIVSLWKVDDEATRELMVKFYELWTPDGKVSTAEALKRAQHHVRDHKDHDWKHPYYWAAWQLWGLPD